MAGRRLVARLIEQQDVEVLDRLQPLLVLLPAADPRVEGPAGVAGEARRTPRRRLELRRDAWVAQEHAQPAQLVVHQRVHRVKDERADCGGLEGLWCLSGF